MTERQDISTDTSNSVPLKFEEALINPDRPWTDDLLSRQGIAKRLTSLVATQKPPLTVSLHGQWGTGKTFMLKRWQRDLEIVGWQAIYFNAWEDDFSDDPLLSILGQLSNHFTGGPLSESVRKVTRSALPLLKSNVSSLLNRHTGLTTDFRRRRPSREDLFKDYVLQHNTKDQLKTNLQKVSAKVRKNSKHPLVFIIDELDRCRPTFAIELLEQVKHIFDVSNIVFVFALNRDELCKSLASVYGDINTDVYLRRFFDFEFNLPEANSQEFALYLIDKFHIGEALKDLSTVAGDPVHRHDFDNYRRLFPKFWPAIGLSLRDIDYGIRLLAFLTKNIKEHIFTHPYLLALLIGMKFKDASLYPALIKGNFRANEVMDDIYDDIGQTSLDEDLFHDLCRMEGFLYCADSMNSYSEPSGEKALGELTRVSHGETDVPFKIISRRAQSAEGWPLSLMIQAIQDGRNLGINRKVFSRLASLVDMYQTELRR